MRHTFSSVVLAVGFPVWGILSVRDRVKRQEEGQLITPKENHFDLG